MVLAGQFSNSAPPPLLRALQAFQQLNLPDAVTRPNISKPAPGRVLQLTPAEVDQVVAGYLSGRTTRHLAADFGVHRHTISKHLRDRGIRTVNKLSDVDPQAAIQLYAQGWSLARIGERLGRDHTVIRNALKRAGVPRRDTHGRVRSS